jgi:ATP-dependent protease ClpP protease subunit
MLSQEECRLFRPYSSLATVDADGVCRIEVAGHIDDGSRAALLARLGAAVRAGARAILLAIDSEGGNCAAARAMSIYLSNCAVPTVAFVRRAHSAGATIAVACTTIVAEPEGAGFLVHSPQGGTDAQLENARADLVDHIWRRTAMEPAEIGGMLSSAAGCYFVWRSGWEALTAGLCDEVGSAEHALQIARDLAAGSP